jgi:hypothetical protein
MTLIRSRAPLSRPFDSLRVGAFPIKGKGVRDARIFSFSVGERKLMGTSYYSA